MLTHLHLRGNANNGGDGEGGGGMNYYGNNSNNDNAPFVGRTRQLEKMLSILQQVPPEQMGGCLSFLLWQGSPGCGKSTLVRKFLESLQDNSNVLTGYGCFPDAQLVNGQRDSTSALFQAVDSLLSAYVERMSSSSTTTTTSPSSGGSGAGTAPSGGGGNPILDRLSPLDLSTLLPFLPTLRSQIRNSAAKQLHQHRVQENNINRVTTALHRLFRIMSTSDPNNKSNNGDATAAGPKLVVWCLDDLHYAPGPALNVLEQLLTFLKHTESGGARWLVIGTCQSTIPPSNNRSGSGPPFPQFVQRAQTRYDFSLKDMPALTVNNVSQLLARAMGMVESEQVISKLRALGKIVHNQSYGHALTTQWHIRLLQDLRMLPRQAKMSTSSGGGANLQGNIDYFLNDIDMNGIAKLSVFEGASSMDAVHSANESSESRSLRIREIFSKLVTVRWRAMPGKVQSLLQVAAAYGPVFGADALYGILTAPTSAKKSLLPQYESAIQVHELLAYAEQMMFLKTTKSSGGFFAFSHHSVRQVVYASTSAAGAKQLHLELGRRCYASISTSDVLAASGSSLGGGTYSGGEKNDDSGGEKDWFRPLMMSQSSERSLNTSNHSSSGNGSRNYTEDERMLMWGLVQQWNRAMPISNPQERHALIELHAHVARLSLEQYYWFSAAAAVERAIELLGYQNVKNSTDEIESSEAIEKLWSENYDKLLDWIVILVQAEFACGRLDNCRRLGKIVLRRSEAHPSMKKQGSSSSLLMLQHSSPHEHPIAYKYEAYQTQIANLLQQHRHKNALGLTWTVLRELGEPEIPKLSMNGGMAGIGPYIADRIVPQTQSMLVNFNFQDWRAASGDCRLRRRSSCSRRLVPADSSSSPFYNEANDATDLIQFWERMVDISQLHSPNYQALALIRTLQLSVEYNRCFPMTGLAFVFWGFVLAEKGLVSEGRRFANMGMALVTSEISLDPVYVARAKILYAEVPMLSASSPLVNLQELQRSNEILCWHGYLEAACIGRVTTFWAHFGSEGTLETHSVNEMRSFLRVLRDYGQDHLACLYAPLVRLANQLTVRKSEDKKVADEEKQLLQRLVQKDHSDPVDMTPAFLQDCVQSITFCRMVGAYMYGDSSEAAAMMNMFAAHGGVASQKQDFHRYATSSITAIQLFLVGMVAWSLIDADQSDDVPIEEAVKNASKRTQQGQAIARKLEEWEKRATVGGGAIPANLGVRPMLGILKAQELVSRPSRVNFSTIANAFESGISAASSTAKKRGTNAPFCGAVGCERAALFFKMEGELRTASTYYRRSIKAYHKWGAAAKANALEEDLEVLLKMAKEQEEQEELQE